ncbi:MAG TPA: OsmC family protein [Elusimicrobiota bacterium]|nr:OsmC family protein [Elusimicrobiota bacterium]
MVKMTVRYLGGLRCEAVHGPSQTTIQTDAPVDNMGKGEFFSPTDLVATALVGCILTTMGIVAQRNGLSLERLWAEVEKDMVKVPERRIGALRVTVHMPNTLTAEDRRKLESAGHHCPVHKSLHPDIDAPVTFVYDA